MGIKRVHCVPFCDNVGSEPRLWELNGEMRQKEVGQKWNIYLKGFYCLQWLKITGKQNSIKIGLTVKEVIPVKPPMKFARISIIR